MCECGEAWETQGGDGDQGIISDKKRGNNSKMTIVDQIPTHVPGTLDTLFLIPTTTMQLDIIFLFYIFSYFTDEITSSKR